MFSKTDVKDYYNSTLNHYEKWWDLKTGLSLHYGIWDKSTRTFNESLKNTNKIMMDVANISPKMKVLDAGCGVGGAAFFLSENRDARVTGISLSEKQIAYAKMMAINKNLDEQTDFFVMDYTNTEFHDHHFDCIWACESISSAPVTNDFIKEASRVLKPGGKLILNDFFKTSNVLEDKNNWMKKWGDTWGISEFETVKNFTKMLNDNGFIVKEKIDFTSQIYKSAKRMYRASFLGMIPSELYNISHKNVSRFAKKHYKTGYYQYKALEKGLWKYFTILAEKI